MEFVVFNTLGRRKERVVPHDGKTLKMYSCGPTVYDYAHIGHFRAYVFVDVLRESLKAAGFRLKSVMNITDVGHLTDDADSGEDKIERKARKEGKTAWEIAEFYTEDFFRAMRLLNVSDPDIVCKATDHIREMEELAQKIIDNGFAYLTSDGIYFDTMKLPDYGKLAGTDFSGLMPGARVSVNPEKKNPRDFAIWKFTPPGVRRQMEWVSEFRIPDSWAEKASEVAVKNPNVDFGSGKLTVKGFPGWHIECTAMSTKYLGEFFDIHTGGVDHIPVHHTNEIAQAEGAFGHDSVKYWLHNEFVMVNGEKMSKSKGNFITMSDILDRGFDPLALRYLFLTSHYRSQINFTWESLESAQNSLRSLRRIAQDLPESGENHDAWSKFLSYLADDLDTPRAMAHVWETVRSDVPGRKWFLMKVDGIFKLDLFREPEVPDEVREMARERERLRKEKRWEEADRIRERIREMGYEVEDTPEGTRIRKV